MWWIETRLVGVLPHIGKLCYALDRGHNVRPGQGLDARDRAYPVKSHKMAFGPKHV